MMKHTTIAVDLAKSVFEIAVSTRPGHLAECHRLSRSGFLRFFAAPGHRRARSLRLGPPLGPKAPRARSHGRASAPAVRPPLRP